MFKIFLSHREDISRVSKEHITSLLILRHVLILALLEILKLLRIIALYPTCLVEMNGLPATLGIPIDTG